MTATVYKNELDKEQAGMLLASINYALMHLHRAQGLSAVLGQDNQKLAEDVQAIKDLRKTLTEQWRFYA